MSKNFIGVYKSPLFRYIIIGGVLGAILALATGLITSGPAAIIIAGVLPGIIIGGFAGGRYKLHHNQRDTQMLLRKEELNISKKKVHLEIKGDPKVKEIRK